MDDLKIKKGYFGGFVVHTRYILVLFFVTALALILCTSNTWDIVRPLIGSPILSLIITVSTGIISGSLADKFKYPSMLGMLISGIILRNALPMVIVEVPHRWTSLLWTISLASVIARAGLSLDVKFLLKNRNTVLALGSIPLFIETLFLVTFARIFFQLPIVWAFVMSFGIASISPGVVVPLILNLFEIQGWSKSRLPPIMLASVSVDVLIATTGFGVSLGSAFKHAHENNSGIFHGSWFITALEEISLGILLGMSLALFAWFLFKFCPFESLSTFFMILISTLIMGWGKMNGMTGVACCSIIISWAAVRNIWSRVDSESADKKLKLIWRIFRPFLFPLIGASVSLTDIPISVLLVSLGMVIASATMKAVAAFVVGYFSGFQIEERVFVSGVWTGKASVQAALCTAALEIVHYKGLENQAEHIFAKTVFTGMVAAIIIGGPVAGIWVAQFGKNPIGVVKDDQPLLPSVTQVNL